MENSFKKIGFILLFILISAGGIFLLTRKPKIVEGIETFSDQGRNHVSAGTTEEYNSNPPTSGLHYAEWEKPGIYDKVLEDGKLVHSLEHGYIVISYNCTKSLETEEPHEEIPATELINSPDCQKLVEQIKLITKKTGMDRLIVVPRLNLDTPIALTAWTKLLSLDEVDGEKMIGFINKFRNKGPEKTME